MPYVSAAAAIFHFSINSGSAPFGIEGVSTRKEARRAYSLVFAGARRPGGGFPRGDVFPAPGRRGGGERGGGRRGARQRAGPGILIMYERTPPTSSAFAVRGG